MEDKGNGRKGKEKGVRQGEEKGGEGREGERMMKTRKDGKGRGEGEGRKGQGK